MCFWSVCSLRFFFLRTRWSTFCGVDLLKSQKKTPEPFRALGHSRLLGALGRTGSLWAALCRSAPLCAALCRSGAALWPLWALCWPLVGLSGRALGLSLTTLENRKKSAAQTHTEICLFPVLEMRFFGSPKGYTVKRLFRVGFCGPLGTAWGRSGALWLALARCGALWAALGRSGPPFWSVVFCAFFFWRQDRWANLCGVDFLLRLRNIYVLLYVLACEDCKSVQHEPDGPREMNLFQRTNAPRVSYVNPSRSQLEAVRRPPSMTYVCFFHETTRKMNTQQAAAQTHRFTRHIVYMPKSFPRIKYVLRSLSAAVHLPYQRWCGRKDCVSFHSGHLVCFCHGAQA